MVAVPSAQCERSIRVNWALASATGTLGTGVAVGAFPGIAVFVAATDGVAVGASTGIAVFVAATDGVAVGATAGVSVGATVAEGTTQAEQSTSNETSSNMRLNFIFVLHKATQSTSILCAHTRIVLDMAAKFK